MCSDVKKEEKKKLLFAIFSIYFLLFLLFFSFQSHWKLFLYVSSDFFEVYSLVHFYKKNQKKKTFTEQNCQNF